MNTYNIVLYNGHKANVSCHNGRCLFQKEQVIHPKWIKWCFIKNLEKVFFDKFYFLQIKKN